MPRNDERGQVLVLTAFLLVILLIAAGFAVDMGYFRYSRRLAQTAADAAALAAASQIVNDPTKVTEAAVADAGLNNFQSNWDGTGTGAVGNIAVVCSISTSLTGSGAECDSGATVADYVSVTVTKVQPTFFAKIMGLSQEPITAHAVAHLVNSINCLTATGANPVWNAPYAPGNGYQFTTSLTNTGGAMNNGVSSAGGAVTTYGPGFQLDATGCSVTAPTLTLNLPSVCLHGASINDTNGGNDDGQGGDTAGPAGKCNPAGGVAGVNPYPPSQVASTVDPLASYPAPTLQPGNCSPPNSPPAEYNSGVVPSGTYPCGLLIDGSMPVTLNGFYSVNGITITNTGTVQGTDVTIYNAAGSLGTDGSGNTIYGAVNVDFDYSSSRNPLPGSVQLSAPSDTGILFFQDRNNPAPATISLTKVCGNTSSDSYVQGALYFPDTQLTLISSSPTDNGCPGNSIAPYTFLDASEFLFEGWLTISAPANGPFANTSPVKKAVLDE